MTVTVPPGKIQSLRDFAASVLWEGTISLHDAERILGLMESMRPVAPFAALHYRSLKTTFACAKTHGRDLNQILTLSSASVVIWVSE